MQCSRLAAGCLAACVVLAGCGAAHQPHPHRSLSAAAAAAASRPRQVAEPAVQLGLNVDAYSYPGQQAYPAALAVIAFARRVHANALSVNFPLFMTSRAGSGIQRGPATPTPQQLSLVIRMAEQAGLYVTLRPLLDEDALGGARSRWKPQRPAAWFASYRTVLLPYAAMAGQVAAPEFFVGTELNDFARSPWWAWLDQQLRQVYAGKLAFASNWGTVALAGSGGPGIKETLDAYAPLTPPLPQAWVRYARTLPPKTVLSEVGIAAVQDAYRQPWRFLWPVTTLDLNAQAEWFSAACHAVAAAGLGGIYFWSISFAPRVTSPTLADQGAIGGDGAGAQAIAACFAGMRQARSARLHQGRGAG